MWQIEQERFVGGKQATVADVLEGRATWCVVEGNCLPVMAGMADRSVAHVICDPPYEAEAHTKQRRVKRGAVVSVEPLPFPPMTAAGSRRCDGTSMTP